MKIQFIFSLLLSLLGFDTVSTAAIPTTIHFATEATYPPFEYMDDTGTIKGFDIDLAKALCLEIKAQCTFSNQPFNSLIPSLQLGKFDAIIGAIGITAARQKQVAFTHPYYEPTGSFVAARAKKYQLSDILNRTIGVQAGSTLEKYLHDKYTKQVKIKSYASIQEAFLDLTAGRVDMVLADTAIADAWLKQNKNANAYAIVEKPIIDHTYFGAGYAIATRLDDAALLNSFNQALITIQANGTYQHLMTLYFNEK